MILITSVNRVKRPLMTQHTVLHLVSCTLFSLLLEMFSTPPMMRKRYTFIHPPSRHPADSVQKDLSRPPSKIIRSSSSSSSSAFRNSQSYRSDTQDTKMVDIQLKRAQIEEKYINAKNRLDFNRRRNNLVGDRLKQDQQEVALFLEKLREVRTLEREYFQLNPEQNEMESDEIYDTTGNEIQINDGRDAIEDEKPDHDEMSENEEAFDSERAELNSKEREPTSSATFSPIRKRIMFKSDAMGKVQRTLVKYERKVSNLANELQSSSTETPKSSNASPPKQYRYLYKRNKGSFRGFIPLRPLRRSSKALFPLRAIRSRDRRVREMPAFCRKRRTAIFCEISMY